MKRGGPLHRRTPLGRGAPLRRGAPLERTGNLQRGDPLRSRSSKTAAIYRGPRADLNAELERPTPCALGAAFAVAGFTVCTGRATCWHERRKRSAGGSIVNRANLLAACVACNELVEEQPVTALRLGFTIREGHPDWDAMSARHDR